MEDNVMKLLTGETVAAGDRPATGQEALDGPSGEPSSADVRNGGYPAPTAKDAAGPSPTVPQSAPDGSPAAGQTLAEALQNVPESGTTRERLEYIDLDLLLKDKGNFYSMDGIKELAENIAFAGLQQPLRVRPEGDGFYTIVSGHRRYAALSLLAEEDAVRWGAVPCIVERDQGSPALRELRLIYANADTRRMTSADLSRQAERVEELLYTLKEEGYEFPGRMRDHVAEACKVSKTKLSRLKVIREKLCPELKKQWEAGKLNEAVAYACAQHPENLQHRMFQFSKDSKNYGKPEYWFEHTVKQMAGSITALDKLSCALPGQPKHCENREAMSRHAVDNKYCGNPCLYGKCCESCRNLIRCNDACPRLAEKVRALKADQKAAAARERELRAEKDRPKVEFLELLWGRFGAARRAAGKTVEEFFEAAGAKYYACDPKEYQEHEQGQKIGANTSIPYAVFASTMPELYVLIRAAELFGVSADYLLGLTDKPEGR